MPRHSGGRKPVVHDLDAEADGIGLTEVYQRFENASRTYVNLPRYGSQRVRDTLARGMHRGC